jgi:two-component system, OmpR family, phosphate regulon sensor histidine kinase PhoR
MMALDLKLLLFLALLALLATALAAILLDRRRFRDPLMLRAGIHPADLRTALEAAPFGLLLLDQRPETVYANAQARRLLEIASAFDPLPSTLWRAELIRDVSTAQQTTPPQTHYRVLSLTAEQTLSWWLCPLPHYTLVYLADLTTTYKMEKAARVFLGNLSHELRTPLMAILAHLEVLRTPDMPEVVRQSSLVTLHQETTRIVRLVQDLLELSRLEATPELNLKPVDLLLVAESAMAEVILTAETRGIGMTLGAEAALPRVVGDPDRLQQVFLNILDNAVKYSRTGDKVEVSLTPGPTGLCVTIHDTGPGIEPEHLPLVTGRLYRGRTDVPGSGLGLALAEEILRRHGSHLEIESQATGLETGTTVRFLLPVATPD